MYTKAIDVGANLDSSPDNFRIYKQLSRLHSELGNMQEHLKYDSLYENSMEVYTKSKEELLKSAQAFNMNNLISQHDQAIASNKVKIRQQRTIIWLVAALSVMVLAFLVFFAVVQIRRRKRLADETSNQLLQSELKALRSQINPHFLFNALNSIQRFVVKNEVETADGYLTKFSKLMRYTLEHSDKMTVAIREEINSLEMYIKMEQLRADFKFDYEINLDDSIDSYHTQVPAMVLQPFVENAIWHGLVPKEEKGKLDISFKEQNHQVIMEVQDNGVGFDTAHLKVPKDGHKSAGMRLITERISLLQDYFKQSFDLNITSNVNGHSGTIVTIKVPDDLV